jgi:hypothetical protein
MTQGLPPGLASPADDGGDANPLDQPDAWDVVVLGGQPSPGPPGYAVVSGASAPRKLDIKDGQGQSGATVTYKGEKLSQFTVTIYLVETSDWVAWFKWRKLLEKPPLGVAAKAIPIYHPALAALKIASVLIEEEGQPEPDGETGLYKVPIKMVQWKKPTPTLGTPQGSADGSNPTPQDAAEAKIADLAAQVRGLAG